MESFGKALKRARIAKKATLREVGIPENGLEKLAEAVLHDRSLATNPKPIYDAGSVMQVLRAAW